MKKLLLLLTLLLSVTTAVRAEEEVILTMDTTLGGMTGTNSYLDSKGTIEQDSYIWDFAYLSNNGNSWTELRGGQKDNDTKPYIATTFAIDRAITKVTMDVKAVKASSVEVTSTLYIADNVDFANATTVSHTGSFPSTSGASATISYPISESTAAANKYYKVEISIPKSVNGWLAINNIKYYATVDLSIAKDPGLRYSEEEVEIEQGDTFTNPLTNEFGVAVTYTSSEPTIATVDENGKVTALAQGTATITASSEEQVINGRTYSADEVSYTVTVTEPYDEKIYTLVTSNDQLRNIGEGTTFIIASNSKGVAISNTVAGGSYLANAEEATISTDIPTLTSNRDMMTFTLGGSEGAWTLQTSNYADTNGYLGYSGSNNSAQISDSDPQTLSITIDATTGEATITPTKYTTRILRYNSSANPSRFAFYTSGQTAVQLYKYDPKQVELTVDNSVVTVNGKEANKLDLKLNYTLSTVDATSYALLMNDETITTTAPVDGKLTFAVEYVPYDENPTFAVAPVVDNVTQTAEAINHASLCLPTLSTTAVTIEESAITFIQDAESTTAYAMFKISVDAGELLSEVVFDIVTPDLVLDNKYLFKLDGEVTVTDGAADLSGFTYTPDWTVKPVFDFATSADDIMSVDGAGVTPQAVTGSSSHTSGVEGITVDSAPVEYYNLQGVRVANPEAGIFIRRQGNSVTKVRM